MSRAHRRVPPQDRVELSNFRAPPAAKKGGSAERFYSAGADAESVPGPQKRCAALRARHVLPGACLGASRCSASCAIGLACAEHAPAVRWLGALAPWFGERWRTQSNGGVGRPCGMRDGIAGLPFASIRCKSRSVQSSPSALRGPAGGSLLLKPVAACVRCACPLRARAACGPLPLFPSRATWRRAASFFIPSGLPCALFAIDPTRKPRHAQQQHCHPHDIVRL